MKDKQDEPLFDVQQLGRVKIYEATKGVDWLSQFPEESDGEPAKLIDLPLVIEPPTSPPPPPALVVSDEPVARPSLAALYPQVRTRTPRAAIAASISTVIGTVAFLYWLVSPPVVQTSPGLSAPPNAESAERLTVDALAPAVEPAPAPSPVLPEPSIVPEPTPTPAPANTRRNARESALERGRASKTPLASPRPAPRKPTPTSAPASRAAPPVTARATPTASPLQSAPRPAAPALAIQPALTPSPSPSPLPAAPPPINVGAPPPSTPPQPPHTPLPTPSPKPSATASSTSASTPAASAAGTGAAERAAVRTVLDQYRAGFESLHSESLKAVWPDANTRALARAFEQLQSQTVDFYSCGIELAAGSAEATCSGAVTFVPKVGGKTPRVESRSWTFFLKRQNDRWIIERVVSR